MGAPRRDCCLSCCVRRSSEVHWYHCTCARRRVRGFEKGHLLSVRNWDFTRLENNVYSTSRHARVTRFSIDDGETVWRVWCRALGTITCVGLLDALRLALQPCIVGVKNACDTLRCCCSVYVQGMHRRKSRFYQNVANQT